jgi:hypothetical protein
LKVESEDETVHLLEVDESHHSERTMFIMPPEPTGLPPGQTYSYQVNIFYLLRIHLINLKP